VGFFVIDKWDERFIGLAAYISDWSKDPSTKVGAVVVDPNTRRIVSTGFNGFPVGVEDTEARLKNRKLKYEMVVHAEQNALVFAGTQAAGCTIYVNPLPPCARCAVIIIQSQIKRVVCPKPDLTREPWATQSRIAEEMFVEAKTSIDYMI
jgi:dCMP deaminase